MYTIKIINNKSIMETIEKNTALLVMDLQIAIIGGLPDHEIFAGNVATAITNARLKKIPIIYVVVGFRKGMPEISLKNKGFAASKERLANVNVEDFIKIHPLVAPHEGDVVVVKRRVSAFTGSDLEVLLRAYGIQHMVLTGCSTSGVVLSTVREAADKDYKITVLSDGCADVDEEVHRILTTRVFLRQADVLSIADWCNL
jgi:nicotinamidase-related amidase